MKAAVSTSDTICTTDTVRTDQAHSVESAVRRRLLSEPGYQITQLVVRRLGDGVCLEGVVYVDEGAADVSSVVREVRGVRGVLNRMLVCDSPDCQTDVVAPHVK